MVIYLFHLCLLLPVFLFSAEFNATVSRNEVGLGENFILSLTLKEASAKSSPSIEPLGKAFLVHSQQQSSSTVINNGRISSSVTWKFVLSPQNEGEALIPAISIDTTEGTLSSKPIVLNIVKAASSNASSLNDEGISISIEVSHANPYKNEPVFFTVRLTSKQNLANIQVQKFEVEDAIVEVAGEPVIYDEVDNGMRLGVIEFSYMLTPLKAGALKIPSLVV